MKPPLNKRSFEAPVSKPVPPSLSNLRWTLDSGASSNMGNDPRMFKGPQHPTRTEIRIADNSRVLATSKGQAALDPHGHNPNIGDGYYLPEFHENLLSIHKLLTLDHEVHFAKDFSYIKFSDPPIIVPIIQENSSFYIPMDLNNHAFSYTFISNRS